ncbi:MAG TPA: hypothetical protein EYN67_18220 [Flavobacteriales bacterium]|nr:hypothetical protein [Methylococcaceae bacterium]HHZ97424.1 hypothetical protein [Flavobacteriales bacterium]
MLNRAGLKSTIIPSELGLPDVLRARQLTMSLRNLKHSGGNTDSIRPIIKVLYENLDWQLLCRVDNNDQIEVGDNHFEYEYLNLIGGGYREPVTKIPVKNKEVIKPKKHAAQLPKVEVEKLGKSPSGQSVLDEMKRKLKERGK